MIGIDATGLWGITFGIHVYAGRLVEQLLPIAESYDSVVYCRKAIPESFQGLRPRVRFRVAPFENRKMCEQLWLPYEMAKTDLSLFHATYGRPLYCPAPTVLTVDDLFTHRYPERYSPLLRAYVSAAVERAARQAAAIVTPSESSRSDIVKLLGVSPERVTTVPMGVDLDYFRPLSAAALTSVRTRHHLPERFMLHVGGFSPIKNTERIVTALARASRSPELADVRLVFAGKKDRRYLRTEKTARDLGIEDRVVFTGYFPDEDLPALYGAAEVLLYPSLIEGFGLPILGAFACSTPVVTSDRSSLPEVAGDAALLVDPESINMLVDAMRQLATQPDYRTHLVERGRRRVRNYAWEHTAAQTLEVYRRVLSNDPLSRS